MLCCLAEFRQQERNSAPFPYREHDFPGEEGQKGRNGLAEGLERRSLSPQELTYKQIIYMI